MAMTETLQQELIKDLLLESHEGLDRLDRELLTLEQGQGGIVGAEGDGAA